MENKVAAIYARVSTEEQKVESTSLATQEEACLKFAHDNGFEVRPERIVSETYSGLTTGRPKLQQVLDWIKRKDIDGLIIYSTDRFSRNGYDLLTLIRECNVNGVELLCVTEDLGQGPIGELLNFVRGWASGLEAAKIGERTMRGKREHARQGDIPAGFGRYQGYLGLRYSKTRKILEEIPGDIDIAAEILSRGLNGESSSNITRDLQVRDARGASGGAIHRSSVSRVLAHARVYAGVIEWNSIEIRGKVEKPIITEEQASVIAQKLKRNKELSYGFGKRKPLTSRISCGLCGRRYNLDAKKGCYCNGSDPRNPNRCSAPRVRLKKLTNLAFGAVFTALMDNQALVKRSAELRERWERETAEVARKVRDKESQRATFEKRRRLLSFQHENGGLTNEEYQEKLQHLRKDEATFVEQMAELSRFIPTAEPPKPEEVREALSDLSSFSDALGCFLAKAIPLIDIALTKDEEQDRKLQELAEKLDVKAVVYPDDGEEGFRMDVFVNIPIEAKAVQDYPMIMVSPSSPRYVPQQRPPPGPASHALVP